MYFPLFVDLSEKEILVVGAGMVASRRIRSLNGFVKHMTVVAPELSSFVSEDSKTQKTEETKITLINRAFQDDDLAGKDLVLAATDDTELNRRICELCRARGIPVNVCSDKNLCDFQFPSIVESGSVVIGINSSGQDHRLVKETRQRVETLIQDEQFKSKYE